MSTVALSSQTQSSLSQRLYSCSPYAETIASAGIAIGAGYVTAGPFGAGLGLVYLLTVKPKTDEAIVAITHTAKNALPKCVQNNAVTRYAIAATQVGMQGAVSGGLSPQGVVYGATKASVGIVAGRASVAFAEFVQDKAQVAKDSYCRRAVNFCAGLIGAYGGSRLADEAMDSVSQYFYPTSLQKLDDVLSQHQPSLSGREQVEDDVFYDALETQEQDSPPVNTRVIVSLLDPQSNSDMHQFVKRQLLSVKNGEPNIETRDVSPCNCTGDFAALDDSKNRFWYIPYPTDPTNRKTLIVRPLVQDHNQENYTLTYSDQHFAIKTEDCYPLVRVFSSRGEYFTYTRALRSKADYKNCLTEGYSEFGLYDMALYLKNVSEPAETNNGTSHFEGGTHANNPANPCVPPDRIAYRCNASNYYIPLSQESCPVNSDAIRHTITTNHKLNIGIDLPDNVVIRDNSTGNLTTWGEVKAQIVKAKVTNYCYGNQILNIEFLDGEIWDGMVQAALEQRKNITVDFLKNETTTTLSDVSSKIVDGLALPPETLITNGTLQITWHNLSEALRQVIPLNQCTGEDQHYWKNVSLAQLEQAYQLAVEQHRGYCASEIQLLPFNPLGYTIDEVVDAYQHCCPTTSGIGLSIAPHQPIIVNDYTQVSWSEISGYLSQRSQLCTTFPEGGKSANVAFQLVNKPQLVTALEQLPLCVDVIHPSASPSVVNLSELTVRSLKSGMLEKLSPHTVVIDGEQYTSWQELGAILQGGASNIEQAFNSAPKANLSSYECINGTHYRLNYTSQAISLSELAVNLQDDCYAHRFGLAVDPMQLIEYEGEQYLWSDIQPFLPEGKRCQIVGDSHNQTLSSIVYKTLSQEDIGTAIVSLRAATTTATKSDSINKVAIGVGASVGGLAFLALILSGTVILGIKVRNSQSIRAIIKKLNMMLGKAGKAEISEDEAVQYIHSHGEDTQIELGRWLSQNEEEHD